MLTHQNEGQKSETLTNNRMPNQILKMAQTTPNQIQNTNITNGNLKYIY